MASPRSAYFATRMELIRPMISQYSFPNTVGLGGFIGTGGDWRAGVVAIVCAVVSFLIYFPFAKFYDTKLLKEEQAA